MKAITFFRRAIPWSATMLIIALTFFSAGGASAGSVSYVYDSLGRLTKASYTSGAIISYAYDAAGNRINTSTTGGAAALMASTLATPSVSSASMTTMGTATSEASVAKAEQLPNAPRLLSTTDEDPAVYGWNDLSKYPEDMVTAVFYGDDNDRLLHLQGYGIGIPDEIGLWLNGTLLGYLSAATDGTLSPPSLWLLPAVLQLPGENTVELAPRTESQVWGVTRLALYSLDTGLVYQNNKANGDLSQVEGFELHLFNQEDTHSAGYLINLAGSDANSDEGIAVELNETPLEELPQSDNRNRVPAKQIWIAPELLLPGDNRLLITNHSGEQLPWEMHIDRILSSNDPQADKLPGKDGRQ